MDWKELLNADRLGEKEYAAQLGRPPFQQDLDRIIFCEPFRRLANKTQVHPLYEHDHIHHRMIHSLETGSVGRSLGVLVGLRLVKKGILEKGQEHDLSHIVQAACMSHDIGNPPFGHSGEEAIGEWFQNRFDAGNDFFSAIPKDKHDEFIEFEGNAQGFRILTRLEMYHDNGGMRLTNAVLGAFSKYPTGINAKLVAAKGDYVGLKKFGFYTSEAELFSQVADKLGLKKETTGKFDWWRRHPLAFLVEAADDICYNILDIEDAFTAGDLGYEAVKKLLLPLAGNPNKDLNEGGPKVSIISYLRAKSINSSIAACVETFMDNYDDIMSGIYSGSLTEDCSKAKEFEILKTTANNEIFVARRKTELEVIGRQIIFRLMDHFYLLFERLRVHHWDVEELKAKHGYSNKLIRAVDLDLRGAHDEYSALHVFADFISGMTDRYAVKIHKLIGAK